MDEITGYKMLFNTGVRPTKLETTKHEMIGKQVKINGAFPQKTGVILRVYPAGMYHPEELFQITILDHVSNTTILTRSEFEIL